MHECEFMHNSEMVTYKDALKRTHLIAADDNVRIYSEASGPLKTLRKSKMELTKALELNPHDSIERITTEDHLHRVDSRLDDACNWDTGPKEVMNSNSVKSWLRQRQGSNVKIQASSKMNADAMWLLKDMFKAFDADGSGTISKTEFGQAVTALDLKKYATELNDMWVEVDVDGSDALDLNEFADLLGKNPSIKETLEREAVDKWGAGSGSFALSTSTFNRRRKVKQTIDDMEGHYHQGFTASRDGKALNKSQSIYTASKS